MRAVFDKFFKDKLASDNKKDGILGSNQKEQEKANGHEKDEAGGKKRRRCGVCKTCNTPDCGKCRNCLKMTKYGGSGVDAFDPTAVLVRVTSPKVKGHFF